MHLRPIATSVGLVLLGLTAFGPQARANFIVNGSFEDDPFTGSGLGYRLGLVGADVTGWFIPASDGTYPWGLQNVNAFGAGPAADGNQWFVLGEAATGVEYTIQQTMHGLVAGNTYTLTFDIASETGCCSTAEVSFLSGSSTGAQDFVAPSSGDFWTQWGAETMNFVATSSDVTLQFQNVDLGPGVDLGLDKVDVEGAAAIPEPASLVMLGLGLLGFGWACHRRA